jgi:cephalosporin hydroxylase
MSKTFPATHGSMCARESVPDIIGDMSSPGIPEVDEAYKIGLLQNRSEIESLYNTVIGLRPKTIIDIGVAYGGTTMLWLGMPTVEHVVGIDLEKGPGSPRLGDGGFRGPRDSFLADFAADKGKRLDLLDMDSHSVDTLSLVKTMVGDEVDFIFIDGDHSYNGVRADYELWEPMVRDGGAVAFHDIAETDHHVKSCACHVYKLWQEIEGRKVEFNAGRMWGGIGVLFKDKG